MSQDDAGIPQEGAALPRARVEGKGREGKEGNPAVGIPKQPDYEAEFEGCYAVSVIKRDKPTAQRFYADAVGKVDPSLIRSKWEATNSAWKADRFLPGKVSFAEWLQGGSWAYDPPLASNGTRATAFDEAARILKEKQKPCP